VKNRLVLCSANLPSYEVDIQSEVGQIRHGEIRYTEGSESHRHCEIRYIEGSEPHRTWLKQMHRGKWVVKDTSKPAITTELRCIGYGGIRCQRAV
jgi:hypothetical protein